jgi:hypothetical protein
MPFRKVLLSQVLLGLALFPMPAQGNDRPVQNKKGRPAVKRKTAQIKVFGVERQRSQDKLASQPTIMDLQNRGFSPIQYSSKEEMVEKILSRMQEGDCIKELNLFGHSNEGLFGTGKGQGPYFRESTFIAIQRPQYVVDWRKALAPLRNKFCSDGMLTLYGCNVGAGEDGARLLYELADYLKTKVRGAVNLCPGLGYKGPWQIADPNHPRPSAIKSSDLTFERRQTPRRITQPHN